MHATARTDRPGQARPASRALTRPARLDLDSFARATSAHPELVRRLAVLGLLDAEQDIAGRLWFRPAETATMARIQRLRAAFPLNYAALGLVLDLLGRLEAAEARLRDIPQQSGGRSWTRTT